EAPPRDWHGVLVRLRLMAQPSIVRKALRAAGVVGAVLIALHHGDELVSRKPCPQCSGTRYRDLSQKNPPTPLYLHSAYQRLCILAFVHLENAGHMSATR